MSYLRHAAATLVMALMAWLSHLAPIAASELSAEDFVRDLRNRVVAVLDETAPRSSAREGRLRSLFLSTFDSPTIAERALGQHWQTLGKDERQRYAKAIPAYLAAIYASQFADYRSQSFEILGIRELSGQDTVVQTVVQGIGMTEPMGIEVRVRRSEEGFRIRDVAIGGISVLATKRSEFDSFLRRENTATLITLIEEFTAGE